MSSHSQLSKKRKTRTDYGDTEPTGALHALQAIRDKLKVHGAVDPDNCQAEDAGATINVDDTELAQFDGVIEWMKSKTLTAEVCPVRYLAARSEFFPSARATRSHLPIHNSRQSYELRRGAILISKRTCALSLMLRKQLAKTTS